MSFYCSLCEKNVKKKTESSKNDHSMIHINGPCSCQIYEVSTNFECRTMVYTKEGKMPIWLFMKMWNLNVAGALSSDIMKTTTNLNKYLISLFRLWILNTYYRLVWPSLKSHQILTNWPRVLLYSLLCVSVCLATNQR